MSESSIGQWWQSGPPADVHPREFARILAEVPDPYRIAALIAAYTGLRSAQICALRREDITREYVTVPGGKGQQVPTHPAFWAEVHWRPEGTLVHRRDGAPMSQGHLTSGLAQILAARGIDRRATLNNLRHHVRRSASSEALIRQYTVHCTARDLSDATMRVRWMVLRRITGETGAELRDLTVSQITNWLATPGWSAQTRASYHAHLNAFYRWAVDTDLVTVNPMTKIPRASVPQADARPADPYVLTRILAEAPERVRMAAMLAAYQGLRACEIAHIRREDVTQRRLVVREGKGGKTAVLPTHEKIWEAVRDRPPGLLVPSPSGGEYRATTLSTMFGVTLRGLGIHGVTLHPLRHLYATTLLDNGANLRVVQTLLRHSSVATTERYTRVTGDQQAAAIASLNFAA